MFYREAGQFKTSYRADQALFPIRQDQIGIVLILLVAFIVVPLTGVAFRDQTRSSRRFLIFSLAAIGLNLLTGYTGLLSLGTGGLHGGRRLRLLQADHLLSRHQHHRADHLFRLFRAAAGIVFGLPSLRIKGFYLAVATLAAQFFLSWCFIRIPWLYNYNISASIEVPARMLFGIPITGPTATAVTRYLIVLTIVTVMTWLASNLIRGRIGRTWMAVRDMDIAAELIGIKLLSDQAARLRGVVVLLRRRRRDAGFPVARQRRVRKLQHQPVVFGAVHGHHRRARQPARLVLRRRLDLRSADRAAHGQGELGLPDHRPPRSSTFNFIMLGTLIILFLIAEPNGLARLWQIGKQKLRVWPFPY